MKRKMMISLIAIMGFVSALGGGATLLASMPAQTAPDVVAWGRVVQPAPAPGPISPGGGGGGPTPNGNSWGG